MTERDNVQRGYRVTGRVQGVFFRAWTQKVGNELGLRGTVRNRPDGSVEIHASGPREIMDDFQARLGEGSPASHVKRVEVTDSDANLPADFEILR